MIIAIFLTISFTGCSSPQRKMANIWTMKERAVWKNCSSEGFVEGTVRQKCYGDVQKDMANITLLRTYVGSDGT